MKPRLIIYYAICLHLVWGLSLLLTPSPQMVTAIAFCSKFFGSRFVEGGVFIFVALSAAMGIIRKRPASWHGLTYLLPQQFVMVLSAGGAMQAIWRQQFADGVPRPFAFILCDQMPAVLIMAFHSMAVWAYCMEIQGKR